MDTQQNKISLRDKALAIALLHEGKEEVPRGSNAGEFVEECLASVGLGKGNAWCQAFVYRMLKEASEFVQTANPCPKTAGVLDCWNKTSPNNRIPKVEARPTNILPGYQFIYEHGRGLGHTGLVVEVFPDGSFDTIEGNTDPMGSRNGYGVFKRKRFFADKQLKGFIKY